MTHIYNTHRAVGLGTAVALLLGLLASGTSRAQEQAPAAETAAVGGLQEVVSGLTSGQPVVANALEFQNTVQR